MSGYRKRTMEAHRPRKGWEVPTGLNHQVSGDLHQDNFGGLVLMGGRGGITGR